MKRLLFFICLIFVSFGLMAQTGTGWAQQRAKMNLKDTTSFVKAPRTNLAEADYVLEKSGSTYFARPLAGGSLTFYYGAAFHTIYNSAVTALDAAGGGTIAVKDGAYAVTSRLEMIDVSDITVVGIGNVVFTKAVDDVTSTPRSILYIADDITNVKIENITFNNTTVNAVETNQGCIHIISVAPDYLNVDGLEITGCTFSTENNNMRGIQIYATPAASLINNLRIIGNKFIDCYNMAVEVLNQETPWVQDKITNCYYNENYLQDCGAGFSFGGAQTRIDVSHNQGFNVGSGFIETGSISYSTISDNVHINTTTQGAFFTSSSTYGTTNNITITGNVSRSYPDTPDGYSLKGLYIYQADSIWIVGNDFFTERAEINASDHIWFTNNKLSTVGYSALLVFGASTNCFISNNYLDNTACFDATNQGTLFFSGAGTTNNVAVDNIITDAGGDGKIVQGNGAAANHFPYGDAEQYKMYFGDRASNTILQGDSLVYVGIKFAIYDGATQVDPLITDTINLSSAVPLLVDTIPLFTFGLGGGLTADTAVFNDNALAGAFYNEGSDTLVVTQLMGILAEGTGTETVSVQVSWHATFKSGSAVNLNAAALAITSITTGTADVSFPDYKIPPNVFVWCTVSGVSPGNRPSFLSVTISGYKIPTY